MGAGLLALDWAGALGRELMLGCAREGGRAVGEGVGWAGFWLWAGYRVLVFVFFFSFSNQLKSNSIQMKFEFKP